MHDLFGAAIGAMVVIVILVAFLVVLLPSSPVIDTGPDFCEKNGMEWHWGYKEAFDYCVEPDGTAHRFGLVNGEYIFIKEVD